MVDCVRQSSTSPIREQGVIGEGEIARSRSAALLTVVATFDDLVVQSV
jgi:hypothetical protein